MPFKLNVVYKRLARKMLKGILICLLLVPFGHAKSSTEDPYPSIHDVVSFKRSNMKPDNQRVDIESSLTIDIEKLDMERIKQDDSAFRNQIMGDLGGDVLLQNKKEKDARRTQVFKNNWKDFFQADELLFRTKIADCMLQLIYMSRSQIRAFENRGFIRTDSSEYRVGFIVHKLDNLHFKAQRYLTVMVQRQLEGKWNTESTGILNLHHKVVMAHYEFERYFYMEMNLHQRLEQIAGNPIHSIADPTTPPPWKSNKLDLAKTS